MSFINRTRPATVWINKAPGLLVESVRAVVGNPGILSQTVGGKGGGGGRAALIELPTIIITAVRVKSYSSQPGPRAVPDVLVSGVRGQTRTWESKGPATPVNQRRGHLMK